MRGRAARVTELNKSKRSEVTEDIRGREEEAEGKERETGRNNS